jgi:DNA-binding response OmpR family regulator
VTPPDVRPAAPRPVLSAPHPTHEARPAGAPVGPAGASGPAVARDAASGVPLGARIAVIDDEEAIRETLIETLEQNGFETLGYENGRTGLDGVRRDPPDLVLLDVNMPGLDGIEVCRRLRAEPLTARLPVVMLTGLSSESDQLLGYDVGADDYVNKPWSQRTLVARIRAVLRRVQPSANDAPVTHGPLTLYPGRWEAHVEGKPVPLTPTEFRLLHLLATNYERALSRAELLELREGDRDVTDRNVDVHVLSIRKKLGKHAGLIATVWGVGYRLGSV